MKYIVEVKYTNPAHEHVSLRRRVDTVRRVVEAATETEAINRVTRQQRSLGFIVKESAVVNTGGVEQSLSAGSPAKPKKKVVGDEGETEIKKEPVKEADSKRYMRPVENQLPAGLDKPKKNPEETKKEPVKEAVDGAKTRNPGYGYHGQHSDAKTADTEYSKAHAMVMQHAKATSSQARDYLDSSHGRHLAGNENPGYIKKDFSGFMKRYTPDSFKNYKESVDEARVMSDPVFRSVSSKILTKNMDPNFGYAPNKLPTHIKAAQAKSDALSKVEKRPQAGTLAAMKKEEVEYIEEKLTAGDPASKWIHDFVHSDNPKFEGKSKKERISMALGAKYAANRAVKEEAEQIDERNKENADRRKMMDAERGAEFKSQGHHTPEPTSKQNDDEAHSKMVGRAIRKMTREEVELDEGSMDKMSLSKLWDRHDSEYYTGDQGSDHGRYSMKLSGRAADAIKKHVAKKYGDHVANDMETHSSLMTGASEYLSGKEANKAMRDAAALRKKHNIKGIEGVSEEVVTEEVEQIDEAQKRAINITKADLDVIKSGDHETVKNHMAKLISRAADSKTNARPLRPDKAAEFLNKIHSSHNVGQLQKMAYNMYLGGDDEGKAKYGKLHVYQPQSAMGRSYQKRYGIGEAVEDKKASKGRKAAERMVNLAKSKKNQINLEPFVDTHKVPMLPTTMGK